MKGLPPPPEPDPLTLNQIYENITSSESSAETRAYNIEALNTVAFHPTVKLFFFEYHSTLPSSGPQDEDAPSSTPTGYQGMYDRIEQSDRLRRESLLKNIAFFLCMRNNPLSSECRWETLSLIGEMCRMEQGPSSSGKSSSASHNHAVHNCSSGKVNDSTSIVGAGGSAASPSSLSSLQEKLNRYAKANLEFFATLPWFRMTLESFLKHNQKEGNNGDITVGSSSSLHHSKHHMTNTGGANNESSNSTEERKLTKEEIRAKFQARREQRKMNESRSEVEDWKESDEDVLIVIGDLLRALPAVTKDDSTNTSKVVWTRENVEQAHDLMFLDASTSMAHLIPLVSRSYSNCCANCLSHASNTSSPSPLLSSEGEKKVEQTSTSNKTMNNSSHNVNSSSTITGGASGFPRCSGCKAVFYCSPECQKAHWGTAHRQPCMAYKERKNAILSQYYALNSKGKQSSKRNHDTDVSILEVPLEPSLYFETRRFLYDHRDSSFENINFSDYFLKYTVRGS